MAEEQRKIAQKIVPHLWFDGTAEAAAEVYAGLVPGSGIIAVSRFGKAGVDIHGQPEGRVMTVDFHLGGHRLTALNGGPHFRPTPAVSFFVVFEERAALERAWTALSTGGRVLMPIDSHQWAERYGWLDDRFGVSWQFALGRRADIGGQTLAPSLLFTGARAGEAEAAIAHYGRVFPGFRIEGVLRHDGSGPDPEGTLKHAQFYLAGQTFMAMDSAEAHGFGFSEANSFLVLCDDQAEIDHYWQALSAVPEAERCGWLKDRFGLSWQIVPSHLPALMGEPEKAERVMAALLEMRKLDIETLERAAARA